MSWESEGALSPAFWAKLFIFQASFMYQKTYAMCPIVNSCLISALILCAGAAVMPSVQARPLGLHTGSIGDGYVFSAVSNLEFETALEYVTTSGKATLDHKPRERWDSAGRDVNLRGAVSYRASPDFLVVGAFDQSWLNHDEEFRQHPWSLNYRYPQTQLSAKVLFDRGTWILGAVVGISRLGKTQRKLSSESQFWLSERSAVVAPFTVMSVGYQFSSVTLLVQLYARQGGDYTTEAYLNQSNSQGDEGGGDDHGVLYDGSLGPEIRSSAHLLVDFSSEFQLAGSVSYHNAEAHRGSVNRWAAVFTEDDQRRTGGGRVAKDFWQVSGGGRYFATTDFSVSGALGYRSPSYQRAAYFEERPLGGVITSFDVEFVTSQVWRWNLAASYQPQMTRVYTYPHSEEDISRHHRIPLPEPTKIEMSQGEYSFRLSLSYLYDTQNQGGDLESAL